MVDNIDPVPVMRDDVLKDPTIAEHRPNDDPEYDVDISDDNDDDVELQIVDDTPEEDKNKPVGAAPDYDPDNLAELEGIGERTRQRIDRMRHEFHNEKRRANEADRKYNEALQYAQGLQAQVQRLSGQHSQMTDTLAQSLTTSREQVLEAAKAKYAKAYEDGDAKAIAEANAEIAQAAADLATIKATAKPKSAAPPAQQPGQQPGQQPPAAQPQAGYRPAAQPLLPVQQQWLEANRNWFNQPGHEAATGYAYLLDTELRNRGVDPKSDAFYNEIVTRVRQRYPQIAGAPAAGQTGQHTPMANGQPPQVPVAPAGNQNGTSKTASTKTVRITKAEVDIARSLGLTPKEYARSKRAMEAQN